MKLSNLRLVTWLPGIIPTWSFAAQSDPFEAIARPLMELSVVLIANLIFFVCLLGFVTINANKVNRRLKVAERNIDIDPLTQILNRRGLNSCLDKYKQTQGFYFVVDIDDFKKINDTYGHNIGDEVILHVASVLQAQVREEDLVARYGGEEFIVYLPSTSRETATQVANRLVDATRNNQISSSDGNNIPITISLGGFEKSESELDFDSIFSNADKQLYMAKSSGKNKAMIQFAINESNAPLIA